MVSTIVYVCIHGVVHLVRIHLNVKPFKCQCMAKIKCLDIHTVGS